MSRLHSRGWLAGSALAVALLSSAPARAQFFIDPRPGMPPGTLAYDVVTGVLYDRVNLAKAEQRLDYLQGKLARDVARGNSAAAEGDTRWIIKDKYRIAADKWLIRKNSLCDPGYYPVRTDAISCRAVAEVARPSELPPDNRLAQLSTMNPTQGPGPTSGSPAAAPSVTVTVVNNEAQGTTVDFAIDGVAKSAGGGSRQEYTVTPESIISFDAGGSTGQRRYQLSAGLYEFRSTVDGWALYKMPTAP